MAKHLTETGLFKTDQEIEKAIVSIETSSKRLREKIHKTGCSILRRWHETGDVRPAVKHMTALHAALGGAVRTNAFKDWVIAYCAFEWDSEAGFVKGDSNTIDRDSVRSAIQNPFWEFSPETEYKPVDWAALLHNAINRAEKDREKLGDKSSVDEDELNTLKQLLANHNK